MRDKDPTLHSSVIHSPKCTDRLTTSQESRVSKLLMAGRDRKKLQQTLNLSVVSKAA
jgi:hypothetical protein